MFIKVRTNTEKTLLLQAFTWVCFFIVSELPFIIVDRNRILSMNWAETVSASASWKAGEILLDILSLTNRILLLHETL